MPAIKQRKINDAVEKFRGNLPKLVEIGDDYSDEKQKRDTDAVKDFVNSPMFTYIKEMK